MSDDQISVSADMPWMVPPAVAIAVLLHKLGGVGQMTPEDFAAVGGRFITQTHVQRENAETGKIEHIIILGLEVAQ